MNLLFNHIIKKVLGNNNVSVTLKEIFMPVDISGTQAQVVDATKLPSYVQHPGRSGSPTVQPN